MVVVSTLFLTPLVTAVISTSVNKMISSGWKEIDKIKKHHYQLVALSIKVNALKDDFRRLNSLENDSIKQLAQRTIEICYTVDDIIDGVNLENMRFNNQNRSVTDESRRGGSSGLSRVKGPILRLLKSSRSLSPSNTVSPAVMNWKLSRQISDLNKEVDQISKGLNSQNHDSGQPPYSSLHCEIRDIHIPSRRMRDKEEIISNLLQMPNNNNFGVSIVGMAGLGKTVLAKSILDDHRIKSHFNVIEVSTSDNWGSTEGLKVNTMSRNGETSQPSSSHSGRGCRSLLWLDDLRNFNDGRDIDHWRILKEYIHKEYLVGTEPTALIITSRDPRVSKITETQLCLLQTLSVDECQDIIWKEVTPKLNQNAQRRFQRIIESMAKKSSGLPLAAHASGLYLRSECHDSAEAIEHYDYIEDSWKHIFYYQILPHLGFDQLPEKLMEFLAYFALFPSTHKFKEHELLQLWRAEGLMKDNAAVMTALKPPDNHFHTLVSRSILHSEEPSPRERAASATYWIHEFTRRYAESVAWSTHFRFDQADQEERLCDPHIHHFSACYKLRKDHMNRIRNSYSRLRTFLLDKNHESEIEKVSYSFFMQHEYIRVLSLCGSDIEKLPVTIKNLKHLRYLDMSHTPIKLLTEVCNLFGLQVLKLNPCNKLCSLPENIGNLINLLHLDLNMRDLRSPPVNLGKLTNLQTLPLFLVLPKQRVSELKNMNSLEGSIRIANLENVIDKDEAMKAGLSRKKKITKLELEWTENSRQEPSTALDILASLKPHDRLTELKISYYKGTEFPIWVSGLKNLASIHLFDCPNCLALPPFGELQFLRILRLENMSKIKTVHSSHPGPEHRDYPALERLEIHKMVELTDWGEMYADEMPILSELVAEDCPKLKTLPMMERPSLRNGTKIVNCPQLTPHTVISIGG